jgi:hypothetical protein
MAITMALFSRLRLPSQAGLDTSHLLIERVRQIKVRAAASSRSKRIKQANRHDGDAAERVRNVQREPRWIVATKWRA